MLTTEELEVLKDLVGAMRELAESNHALAKAQLDHADALLAQKEDDNSATLD